MLGCDLPRCGGIDQAQVDQDPGQGHRRPVAGDQKRKRRAQGCHPSRTPVGGLANRCQRSHRHAAQQEQGKQPGGSIGDEGGDDVECLRTKLERDANLSLRKKHKDKRQDQYNRFSSASVLRREKTIENVENQRPNPEHGNGSERRREQVHHMSAPETKVY